MRLLRGHRRRFQYGFPRRCCYCSRTGFPRCFPDCSRMVSLRFPSFVFGNKRLRKLCLNTVSGAGFLFGFHTSKGKTILPQTGKTGLTLDMTAIPTRSHQTVSKRFCLGGLARGIHIIRITLVILAIVIFVVILLSR